MTVANMIRRKGTTVSFRLDSPGTYDETTDRRTNPTSIVVAGSAIPGKSDPLAYQALNLRATDAITLAFSPDVPGALPPLGASVTWGGVTWVVRSVEPFAPKGAALAATIIAQGAGPVSIGVPSTSAAVLFYRLTAGDALPTGTTIVRNGPATQIDANGVLQTVGPNVLRDGHYIGGVRTQLIESQRANNLLRSTAIGGPGWANNGSGIAITLNEFTAPDGSQTATGLRQGAALNATRWLAESASGLGGQTVTTEAWIRLVSGTPVGIRLWQNEIGGAGQFNTPFLAVTAQWQRFTFTRTLTPGSTAVYAGFLTGWDGNGGASDAVYAVWQGQLEPGAYATSDILTTTAVVTRPADILTIPGVNIGGATATLYQKYYDLATAAWVETVTPYTSNANLPRVADRAYALDKIALGTRMLAEMQAL